MALWALPVAMPQGLWTFIGASGPSGPCWCAGIPGLVNLVPDLWGHFAMPTTSQGDNPLMTNLHAPNLCSARGRPEREKGLTTVVHVEYRRPLGFGAIS